MTPPKRTVLAALPLVVALLAGCELRADVDVTIDNTGGGRLAVTLTPDEALRRSTRQAGADPLAALADAGSQVPGWRVRSADGDGGVTLATTFDDPDELALVSAQFADAVAAPELRPLEPLEVVLGADTVELRGGAGLDVTPAVRDIGYSPARARAVIADSVRLRITARMPGAVLETNAGERRDERTVSWLIPAGQQRRLEVVATRPWTAERVARLLITPEGVLALLIGTTMVLAWRRTRRHAPLLAHR
ncbi:hypothetical protein BH23ACT10_BH23ACT10_04620 [soil metagenome]